MDKTIINQRRNKLNLARENLKKTFFGLDNVIDQVINSISCWWILPEVINRPTIICLWGMTGVGKTALVRELSKQLQYSDRFLEIQMDTINEGYSNSSLLQKLQYSGLAEGSANIVLLDEFQRFRTKDQFNRDVENKRFQDVWQFLSDGKFPIDLSCKTDLEWYINNELDDKEKEKKLEKYEIAYVRKVFKINIEPHKMLSWNKQQLKDYILQNKSDTFTEFDYSKSLIFICGNLDEAYSMSTNVGDCDTDADTFHAWSKNLNILNIKSALNKRFKPEQISRLGNSHVIYPSLSKKTYMDIIYSKLDEYKKYASKFNINIKFDSTVANIVYQNGVFPSQGIRPVFSTLNIIVQSHLPEILLASLDNDMYNINIYYSAKNNCLYVNGENNQIIYQKLVDNAIDKLRKDLNEDKAYNLAVHELGHSIVFSKLFKVSPQEIKIAANGHSAYVIPNAIHDNKNNIRQSISILWGGHVAETLFFGNDISGGSETDIAILTQKAASYVRELGFDGFYGKVGNNPNNVDNLLNNSMETNSAIHQICQEEKNNCYNILKNFIPLFKKLIPIFVKHKSLSIETFVREYENFTGEKISCLRAEDIIISNYRNMFDSVNI